MWTSEAYPSGGIVMYDNWYVIQVRSGREEEIRETCQRLIPQGTYEDCFIPKCKRMKKFRGQWQEVEEILFRGYVFMITDHIDVLFNHLKLIPDLTKVLGNDGSNILPILVDEAKSLLKFGKNNHIIEMSKGYIIGDDVEIISGPLVDYHGKIAKIDRHKRIAYIELKLFDRITTVKVGLEIISKGT